MTTNGTGPTDTITDRQKLIWLQTEMDTLIWLHTEMAVRYTELAYRFNVTAQAVAGILAQQMQPQLQQHILSQLTGAPPAPTVTGP